LPPLAPPRLPNLGGQGWRVDFQMMDVSRHKSVETLRRYVSDAGAFQDHAGKDFL
jgi:hypothetical protein